MSEIIAACHPDKFLEAAQTKKAGIAPGLCVSVCARRD
jgi:hypothetical protein